MPETFAAPARREDLHVDIQPQEPQEKIIPVRNSSFALSCYMDQNGCHSFPCVRTFLFFPYLVDLFLSSLGSN